MLPPTTPFETRVTVLLAVWDATLDAELQIVVMAHCHEEDGQDHGRKDDSDHAVTSAGVPTLP